ncbi:TIGR02678 family protein [Oceanobacillus halophilus]|uniref:TIGR02678 family protein n=1 Tax=Oceanobacillus halophilus TaxID=930130 RepID=A0A495A7U3_9BACI|nr:TIGR02678 family protein [Oceanobacillus halophilus]RKQ35847.1 TIGR02678 family protein [Oceanobacillus halophilus]
MDSNLFDEKAEFGLRLLLEKFWILRSKDPEQYQLIREREKVLKRYVDDKFGFDLTVHQHFIKLEKIPVQTKSWMGIQGFQAPLDYAIFCCALAFTENRSVDEQFLLSEICEEMKDIYPGEFPLDWTNYNHRKSLVRVIKQLEKLAILTTVDGEIDQFAQDEGQEVLYEVTVYARYFMRTYPKDIFEYDSMEDILEQEWERHEAGARRKRVYRQLFLSPVVYRRGEDDPDFAYIRNYRNRLKDDIEEHTLFRLEVFKNAAMLVTDEKKQEFTLFPDQKAIMDVALHFSAYLRNHLNDFPVDTMGNVRLTYVRLEQMMTQVHQQYGKGWSKQYRNGTIQQTLHEFLALLKDWEMLEEDSMTNTYRIKPLLGRVSGYYPSDFLQEEAQSNE